MTKLYDVAMGGKVTWNDKAGIAGSLDLKTIHAKTHQK